MNRASGSNYQTAYENLVIYLTENPILGRLRFEYYGVNPPQ